MEKGITLEEKIKRIFENAKSKNVLHHFDADVFYCRGRVLDYAISYCPEIGLRKKDGPLIPKQDPDYDPFMKREPDLFIGEFPPYHYATMNKFSVTKYHFLLLTTEFESQKEGLNEFDFQAIKNCQDQLTSKHFCFYNCGPASGASQKHKHAQFFPLEMFDGHHLPPDDLEFPNRTSLEVKQHPRYPIKHFILPLPPNASASDLFLRYEVLMNHVKNALHDANVDHFSYNLVINRDWMLAVPRKEEFSFGRSMNSICIMCILLADNQNQLANFKKSGICEVLMPLGLPRDEHREIKDILAYCRASYSP